MNNLKEKILGLNFKKILKIALLSLVGLGLVGGGVGYAHKSYSESQEEKTRETQSTIIKNLAKEENVSLKSEEEIKNALSKAIDVNVENINFDKIYLTDGMFEKRGGGRKHKKGKGEPGFERGRNNYDRMDSSSKDEPNRELEKQDSTSNENNNKETTENTTSESSSQAKPKYFYKVKAEANGTKYKAHFDAQTGKIISIKVD